MRLVGQRISLTCAVGGSWAKGAEKKKGANGAGTSSSTTTVDALVLSYSKKHRTHECRLVTHDAEKAGDDPAITDCAYDLDVYYPSCFHLHR